MSARAGEPAPPATLVIFGGTGDLTRRLLVPALANLASEGLIGEDLSIIGIGSRGGDDAALRDTLDEFVPEAASEAWQSLRGRVSYLQGDFTGDALFAALKAKLPEGNAAFYLATPPQFFGPVVEKLADAGLMEEREGCFRRVVIEKPFGHDLESARALNRQILARIGEAQTYRIDHFLGKETVQNILVTRFGNPLLEAVWNSRYIDHVQITAAEAVDVGTRGSFYDATGALRDMVPNHLFQLLAMIGMEPPNSFDAEAVRNEKAKVLAAVRPIPPQDAARGRYAAGRIGDRDVPDYLATPDVAADSRTETFAAVKLEVESWRWAGVPFFLRTGKALAKRDTEIVVEFRPVPLKLFRESGMDELPPNRLTIQIQPDEGLVLSFLAKKPGPVVEACEVEMDFRYADRFTISGRTGYETLLYDMLMGDQTLFQRADMIESGWAAVDPVLKAWAEAEEAPEEYRAGSGGPGSADALIERDGRAWHAIGAAA
jgi:glucose-6-phosphate 1-dehydrogenase